MAPPRQLAFLFGAPQAGTNAEAAEAEARQAPRRPPERAGARTPAVPTRRPPPAARVPEPRASEPGAAAARKLAAALRARLGVPVRLIITDNRSAMFSARKRDGRVHIRAHHLFLAADRTIVEAMAGAVHRDPESRRRLRAYVRERHAAIRPSERRPKQRRVALRTRGAHHDLAAIFAHLEDRYFPGTMHGVAITWGPAPSRRRRRRRRSIQLGLYIPEDRLIQIHRALDQDWVPEFYVQSVVFHEMLHHCMPPVRRGKQVVFHTPQFRALERVFAHFQAAEQWERVHLDRLLAS